MSAPNASAAVTASLPQQDTTQDAVRAATATLQRRFDRERAARKAAETLLNDKSRALWDALQLARESESRLNLALWATGEGIWVWDKPTQRVQVTGLWWAAWPPTSRAARWSTCSPASTPRT